MCSTRLSHHSTSRAPPGTPQNSNAFRCFGEGKQTIKQNTKTNNSPGWWRTPLIQNLGNRGRQISCPLEASLIYRVKPCLRMNKTEEKTSCQWTIIGLKRPWCKCGSRDSMRNYQRAAAVRGWQHHERLLRWRPQRGCQGRR